jgi:hypothetical protein
LPFQEDAKFVIDLEKPKPKVVRVLAGETMSETAGGRNFEIVQDDNRAARRLVHRQEKRVLAFRRIRRAINQDKFRALQALE